MCLVSESLIVSGKPWRGRTWVRSVSWRQTFHTFDRKLAAFGVFERGWGGLLLNVIALCLHCVLPTLHCVPIYMYLIAFVCVERLLDDQSAADVCSQRHWVTAVGVWAKPSVLCMNQEHYRFSFLLFTFVLLGLMGTSFISSFILSVNSIHTQRDWRGQRVTAENFW